MFQGLIDVEIRDSQEVINFLENEILSDLKHRQLDSHYMQLVTLLYLLSFTEVTKKGNSCIRAPVQKFIEANFRTVEQQDLLISIYEDMEKALQNIIHQYEQARQLQSLEKSAFVRFNHKNKLQRQLLYAAVILKHLVNELITSKVYSLKFPRKSSTNMLSDNQLYYMVSWEFQYKEEIEKGKIAILVRNAAIAEIATKWIIGHKFHTCMMAIAITNISVVRP